MSWLRRSELLAGDDQWAGGGDREVGRGEGTGHGPGPTKWFPLTSLKRRRWSGELAEAQ